MRIDTMGTYGSKSGRPSSRGFTLIAALLMLLLLSGIAIGLMMMVNTEGKVGGTDLQNNTAFHAAEGGIEKMYSDLSTVFQNAQSPAPGIICAVGNSSNQPTMVGVTWTQYSVMPGTTQSTTCPSTLTSSWGQISAGQNKNLWAQVIPVNMLVTASMMGGQEVSMARTAQVALIPAFQFGVFSESDLSYFSGASLDFAGRVHTNGDLYPFVTGGSTLVFHANVSAYGNIVRTQLPNGLDATSNYNGDVYQATVEGAGGCPPAGTAPVASGTCVHMVTNSTSSPYGDGSVTGAGSSAAQSGASYNGTNWNPFSSSTTYQMVNGNYGSATTPGTGATRLSMPFVSGTTLPNELIRQPQPTDSTTLSQSREYNMAQIHVLLADDPADLPGGASDSNNIRLANLSAAQAQAQYGNGTAPAVNQFGITIPTANINTAIFGSPTGTNTYNLYFAAASNAVPLETSCTGATCTTADWPYAPQPWTANPHSTTQGLQPPPPTGNWPAAPTFAGASALTPTINLCPPLPPAGGFSSGVTPAIPANCPLTGAYPYYAPPNASGSTTYNSANANAWSLIDGYLRVEYKDSSGNWNPVTNEWLQLGFARGLTAPTAPGTNPVTPNAILLLQEPADRDATGTVSTTATAPVCANFSGSGSSRKCTRWTPGTAPELTADLPSVAATATYVNWAFGLTPAAPVASGATMTQQSLTQYNWYPINFYDAREGEVRDNPVADNSCTTNGVMNAIEIDVGNLKQWLAGTTGTSGASVDSAAQNGYVLYFSDRRGMLRNPNNGSVRTGDAGLEDVINRSSGVGTPDGLSDPVPTGKIYSPEDVNKNGVLDNWGATNLGLGFWGTTSSTTQNLNLLINTTPARPDPFNTDAAADSLNRIGSCSGTARKNWVSGARHVLRLVDGGLGNIPLAATPITVNGVTYNGGFTVAAENPVYIQGTYNTNSTDFTADQAGHAAAAVIADAVVLLSDDWNDLQSMVGNNITNAGSTTRNPSHDGWYRLGIAGGKNMTFPLPTFTSPSGPPQDFGTDGGVHNFLRYLENWGSQTVHFKGSLVSLYYATYDTGIYKCCNVVYGVPTRDYVFDTDFTVPAGLPPGTPMFRDVESLSYRQVFNPRLSSQ